MATAVGSLPSRSLRFTQHNSFFLACNALCLVLPTTFIFASFRTPSFEEDYRYLMQADELYEQLMAQGKEPGKVHMPQTLATSGLMQIADCRPIPVLKSFGIELVSRPTPG